MPARPARIGHGGAAGLLSLSDSPIPQLGKHRFDRLTARRRPARRNWRAGGSDMLERRSRSRPLAAAWSSLGSLSAGVTLAWRRESPCAFGAGRLILR